LRRADAASGEQLSRLRISANQVRACNGSTDSEEPIQRSRSARRLVWPSPSPNKVGVPDHDFGAQSPRLHLHLSTLGLGRLQPPPMTRCPGGSLRLTE
jgi:hypothetical protein